jgi:hypothetical protein
MKLAVFLLSAGILVALIWYNLREVATKKSEFDDLQDLAIPAISYLRGHSTIGYKSCNSTLKLFARIQFVFIPVILDRYKDHDTLIFIRDTTCQSHDSLIKITDYKVITSNTVGPYNIFLLTGKH